MIVLVAIAVVLVVCGWLLGWPRALAVVPLVPIAILASGFLKKATGGDYPEALLGTTIAGVAIAVVGVMVGVALRVLLSPRRPGDER